MLFTLQRLFYFLFFEKKSVLVAQKAFFAYTKAGLAIKLSCVRKNRREEDRAFQKIKALCHIDRFRFQGNKCHITRTKVSCYMHLR